VYSESHRLEARVLDMTFHYQQVDALGRNRGRERRTHLRHRLLGSDEIRKHLAGAGLSVVGVWGGFEGQPLDAATEQRVYLVRREAPRQRR
jgi:hypothetical protein